MTATAREVALLRLAAQGLAGPGAATPLEAVRQLTAVQGQDLPGALTSVALRTVDRSRAAVVAALDAGEVVRSWPMRGTLHLVAAEDLGWLLELCAVRSARAAATREAQLGITDDDAERTRAIAVGLLSGGGRVRRADLLRAFDDGGVATTGQRGVHLLGRLARTGTLVLGPTQGGTEQLWVLTDEWIPEPRRPGPAEALAEVVLRYLAGHGPATVADAVRWTGLRLSDVRAGLAAVRDRLVPLDVDGVEHWMDPATPDRLAGAGAGDRAAERVLLLPGFDEVVLGYADRSATLAVEHADRVVPGGNGMFRGTVVVEGRVVGTWRRSGSGARRGVVVEPFGVLAPELAAEVDRVAAALP